MAEEIDYYLLVDNETHGPFERAQMVEGLMAGEIPADTLVATSVDHTWVPISSVIQVAPTGNFDAINFGETMVIPKNPKKT